MKTFIRIIAFIVLFAGVSTVSFAQRQTKTETVVVSTVMHCDNCVRKIENNIPFERGVKDISIDFDKQEVTVTYDASKTNPEDIVKAFGKIKTEAKVKTERQ